MLAFRTVTYCTENEETPTYGQSTNPASPHANDQMREFSAKRWHTLPFHRDDVVKARVGKPLRLVRP